jgi:hypothetical protein
MGIGNSALIDCGRSDPMVGWEHKKCHTRNPQTAVNAPKFQELITQLAESVGESVNVSVANVPGNKTGISRYGAGCDQAFNITVAPNIAAKAIKDPAKMEELQAAIQVYLDQCSGNAQEGEQIQNSGLVFLANGDVKTWAITASGAEGAAEDDEIARAGSDILANFDYVFQRNEALQHFAIYGGLMQVLLAGCAENSDILAGESEIQLVEELATDTGGNEEVLDSAGGVESQLDAGDSAANPGEETGDNEASVGLADAVEES